MIDTILTFLQVYQLQVHFVRICAESPEEAIEPTIRFYSELDGDTDGNRETLHGNNQDSVSTSATKQKGKARAYDDNLLSTLEMTPTKKTHTF